jgi:ELWxxDGT repeat protein
MPLRTRSRRFHFSRSLRTQILPSRQSRFESLEQRALLSVTPHLVRDIAAGTGTETFAELNGYVYYANSDPTHGLEIWRTDGTPGGTGLFLDLIPEGNSYHGYNFFDHQSAPTQFVTAGNKMFFVANNNDFFYFGFGHRQLYVTDGTVAGTQRLSNIQQTFPYPTNSDLQDLTLVGDRVFFTAHSGNNARELWVSNGTTAGTHMVIDLTPGSSTVFGISTPTSSFTSSTRHDFAALGEFLVFHRNNQLWISDGTAAGTQLLLTTDQQTADTPRDMTVVGSTLFFAAGVSNAESELWKTDGTVAGTQLVKDINPGVAVSSNIDELVALGDQLYFYANDGVHGDELWRSDGSAAGTTLVVDLASGSGSSDPQWLTPAGDQLYFTADDGVHGRELWVLDGTALTATLVTDLTPGSSSTSVSDLASVDGILYFTVFISSSEEQLWRSDGTSGGTYRLTNLIPGSLGSRPRQLTAVGSSLYLVTNDNSGTRHLAYYDANLSDPILLSTLPPAPFGNSQSYMYVHGIVYFRAGDHRGSELWRTDGTAEGTILVKDIAPDGHSLAAPLLAFGEKLLFTANDGSTGEELWITDGTELGTIRLTDIIPTNVGPANFRAVQFGNRVYFTAAQTGATIFRTDGTVAGTSSVTFPASFNSVAANDQFLFLNTTSSGPLWLSDGTFAGSFQVQDALGVVPQVSGGLIGRVPTTSAGVAYFVASTPATGRELWKTDGTPAGTSLVKDILPGTGSGNISDLGIAGGLLFFRANNGSGEQLWRSDGTEAGTFPVSDSYSTPMMTVVVAGDKAYFRPGASPLGAEVYVSDGTIAGTHVLKDIVPGTGGSSPFDLTAVGDYLVFEADTNATGAELWVSDGTEAGTQPLGEINPGIDDGTAANAYLTAAKNALYLSGDNGLTGPEAWRINIEPNAAPVAQLSGPPSHVVGNALALDASASYDPDGDTELSYFWDLNGDGDYRDAVGQTLNVTWQRLLDLGIDPQDSSLTVSVRVSDGIGGADVIDAEISIIPAPIVAIASLGSQQTYHFDPSGNGALFADTGDGPFSPFATAFDADGNTYVSDVLASRIYKFTPDGTGSIFADLTDGVQGPTHMAFDADGNLFVTSYLTNRIVKLTPDGTGSLFADETDGLSSPFDIAIASTGEIYVASLGSQSILEFDSLGNASLFADTSDGLFSPLGVAVSADGDLFVSDVLTNKIVRFTAPGVGSLFADGSDGLQLPAGLTFDADGNLYVANYLAGSVLSLDPAGVASLFADSGDGLSSPFDIAVYTPAPPPLPLMFARAADDSTPPAAKSTAFISTSNPVSAFAPATGSAILEAEPSTDWVVLTQAFSAPATYPTAVAQAFAAEVSYSAPAANDLALLSSLRTAGSSTSPAHDQVFDEDWSDFNEDWSGFDSL